MAAEPSCRYLECCEPGWWTGFSINKIHFIKIYLQMSIDEVFSIKLIEHEGEYYFNHFFDYLKYFKRNGQLISSNLLLYWPS